MRQADVRRHILETLEMAGGYALPEPALRSQVTAMTRPPVGEAEWDEAMGWLQRERAIASVPNELDPEMPQWALAERGRVMLGVR